MCHRLNIIVALSICLAGCSNQPSLRLKSVENEIAEARSEIDKGKFKDAEARLSSCVTNIGTDQNLLYIKLKALNALYETEIALKNESKAAKILKEASSYGEVLAETARVGEGTEKERLYAEAKIPVVHLGDQMTGEGYYHSARRLYKRAIQLETACGIEPNSESTIAKKLSNLNQYEDSEESALGKAEGAPAYSNNKNMQARRAAKRKLMDEMKALYLECQKHPDNKIVERMLVLLSEIGVAYGKREGEYRGALYSTAASLSLVHKNEEAILLLKKDRDLFSNITDEGFRQTDPTTIENAKFVFMDSLQIAHNQNMLNRPDETISYAKRALFLAEKLKDESSFEVALSLNYLSRGLEIKKLRQEALPFRERQLRVLKLLNDKDKSDFYEAQVELAADLTAAGRGTEALPLYEQCIDFYRKKTKDPMQLSFALNSYTFSLMLMEKYSKAVVSAKESIAVSEKYGSATQKYHAYNLAAGAASGAGDWKLSQVYRNAQLQIFENNKLPHLTSDYILALSKLASLLFEQKQFKAAEVTTRKALAKIALTPTVDNCTEASVLNVLAGCEDMVGNFEEEEKLRLRAYSLLQKAQTTSFFPWISTINQLAQFYRSRHRYKEAEKFAREVINLTEMGNSVEMLHQNVFSKIVLIDTLRADNRLNEANALKDELIKVYPNLSGIKPGEQMSLLIGISDQCAHLQDYKEASRALKLAEAHCAKHPDQCQNFHIVLNERKTNLLRVNKSHN